jgi:hypothetical protein
MALGMPTLSPIVNRPIVDPQVNNARQRYRLVNENHPKLVAGFQYAVATAKPDGKGNLVGDNGLRLVRDAAGALWVDGGMSPDGRFHNFFTVNNNNGGAPGVTIRQAGGSVERTMTITPSAYHQMPGYQINETERGAGANLSSSYGLTPYGAVQGR